MSTRDQGHHGAEDRTQRSETSHLVIRGIVERYDTRDACAKERRSEEGKQQREYSSEA